MDNLLVQANNIVNKARRGMLKTLLTAMLLILVEGVLGFDWSCGVSSLTGGSTGHSDNLMENTGDATLIELNSVACEYEPHA